ncbi:MAG: 4-hydroxy-tetrahydrodipicolinate synthase [Proteobacteria bacterium]|jgi:4-hydroxy-tetrahydrodipicolinate synthase|nr:4-hydroxy-tetrahydrodipicolinate synthase [Pseudomonadota bacterium]MCG6934869.1 4-hydroxy-tetrahydrodipicolinate synthase [Pseudomonadota bacterium]
MFQGSMVALITPMHPDGSLDQDALARLVQFHVDAGTDAIVAMGTTGESATLDAGEHCEVVRRVVELAAGRVPIIAGTGSNSTQEAIELTRCAQQAGVDACLLVTPYYNKPTQEGLYLHFRKIAETVDIPQILYNVPGRTAVDMLPETVARLAVIPNIIGIKEATGDIERGRDILRGCGPQFALYSGDDATAMELILAGARGDISVTANVAPRAMHEMCAAALAGDRATAAAINDTLMVLHRDLFVEANPIPVKWALHHMGMIENGIRLPLTVLSEDGQIRVSQALQQAGIL